MVSDTSLWKRIDARANLLRIAGFLIAALVAVIGAGPVAGLATGVLGLASGDQLISGDQATRWLFPVLISSLLVVVSWIAVRREGLTLHALGIAPTRRRVAEFLVGFALATFFFIGVALLRGAQVGADWNLNLVPGVRAAIIGLPYAFVLLLPEELLFRGYAFKKATAVFGSPFALLLSSLLFGAYHVVGSGYWGIGAVFLFVMPALGGLLFGLAALRTGGLALPIGLHLGGNWVNMSVFGLGSPEGAALWTAQLGDAQSAFLGAADLLPHLPYIIAVALLTLAVLTRPRRLPKVAG